MPAQVIKITGARQHNLRNLTLEIPREKLVVITGLSGSGKSSLAFDTLYAEGQRRYVESLSAYARQFLDQMQKPDVDFIEGLSPAIAIEQRSSGGNPRSTIATTTEIYDYLRLLFSAVGQPHDPKTGAPIFKLSPEQVVDRIVAYPAESRIVVLAPIVQSEVGEFRDVIEKLKREGCLAFNSGGTTVSKISVAVYALPVVRVNSVAFMVGASPTMANKRPLSANTSTLPPGWVYLIALSRRFTSTCSICPGSARILPASSAKKSDSSTSSPRSRRSIFSSPSTTRLTSSTTG